MVFTKRLREGVRRGRIRCTVRIWQRLQVKVGGRYPMDDGHIVIDSIQQIEERDITDALAAESGFRDAEELLGVAKHGSGTNVYLIRFHYLPPGAWDAPPSSAKGGTPERRGAQPAGSNKTADVLRRIRTASPPAAARAKRTPAATTRKRSR